MTYEIERKWLVNEIPFSLGDYRHEEFVQAYIMTSDNSCLRIRKTKTSHYEKYYLTVKAGQGLKREEVEFEIKKDDFDQLFELDKKILTKNRYYVNYYQVDFFTDRNLILVEVEFDDEIAANDFEPPAWFGIEVTDDPKYLNQNLAK